MENWQTGDIAICVDNSGGSLAPPLNLNEEYVIFGISSCGCGLLSLNVGINNPHNVMGCSCCARVVNNEPVWWCRATRFVKKKSHEELVQEALEKEDYETLVNLNK